MIYFNKPTRLLRHRRAVVEYLKKLETFAIALPDMMSEAAEAQQIYLEIRAVIRTRWVFRYSILRNYHMKIGTPDPLPTW